jgi:hypothetical protein
VSSSVSDIEAVWADLHPDQRRPTAVHALRAVMMEVTAVGKDGLYNAAGTRYNFRGIDAVVNAIGPAFRKHGVVPMPMLETTGHRDVQTAGGKASRETTVQVRYRFYGPGGDFVEAIVPGEAMDSGDKGTAKAMSVAYRIALLQVLCLPTTEPDPDSQVYEREIPAEPAWDLEIPQLVKVKDRAGLLKLYKQAKETRPDDTTLHARIVAAGQEVAAAEEPKPKSEPMPTVTQPSAKRPPDNDFDRAKEMRCIWAQLAKGGVDPKDRDRRLFIMTRILTRPTPLESFNDLTDTEIADAVAFMKRREADGDLPETLAQMAPITAASDPAPQSSTEATPRNGKTKMSAQEIDMARNEVAEAADITALGEVWNKHTEAYVIPPALKKVFEKRGEELKRQVTDALWQQILEHAPEDWSTEQIETHFTEITGKSMDEATVEDMQHYLDATAAQSAGGDA